MQVLDRGHIGLVDQMGNDLKIARAAWVSYGKQDLDRPTEDVERVIKYMMKHKHGCFDSKTEVLTKEGWKFWSQASIDDEFLTLSKNDTIEYQKATEYQKRFEGEYMLSIQNSQIDCVVTGDHKIVGRERTHKGWQPWDLYEAKELLNRSYRFKLSGGSWTGISVDPNRAKLLGFFIGDGYSSSTPTFHLKKERKIKSLLSWAEAAGFDVTHNVKNASFYLIADKGFRNLCKAAYDENRDKIIPKEVLTMWDSESLKSVLEGLIESDGHITKTGKTAITTTSYRLAGDIQDLSLKVGLAAKINSRVSDNDGHFGKKPLYVVHIYKSRNLEPRIGWTKQEREKEVKPIKYNDNVYCVTVPNGTLYVRRNGKSYWSGNSPFEHVLFTFHVKAPIFVAREWFRHRIGSFNEISGRYKTLEPEFYIPDRARVPTKDNKQGSQIPTYDSLSIHGYETPEELDYDLSKELEYLYKEAYGGYEEILTMGVANELARLVLPLGLYTEWWWTVNLRSLFNFMNLRSDSKAQWEIQQYSLALEEIVQQQVPIAYNAWKDNNRISP